MFYFVDGHGGHLFVVMIEGARSFIKAMTQNGERIPYLVVCVRLLTAESCWEFIKGFKLTWKWVITGCFRYNAPRQY
jgi:hypothetical protein